MVVSPVVLGASSREPDLSQETNTETINGAVLTVSQFVNITLKESTPHVVKVNPLPNATRLAHLNLVEITPRIRSRARALTLSPTTSPRSKPRSWPLAPSKYSYMFDSIRVPSPSMKTSSLTSLASISTLLVTNSVATLSKSSDGVSRTEPHTGFALTLGMKIGETTVSSRFSGDPTTAELKPRLSLVKFDSGLIWITRYNNLLTI